MKKLFSKHFCLVLLIGLLAIILVFTLVACDTAGTNQSNNDESGEQTQVDEPCEHVYSEWVVTVQPTCIDNGVRRKVCIKCGDTVAEDVDALGHNSVVDPAVAPTCTETGLTEGSHCSRCQAVLIAQQEIAALGHSPVVDTAVAPTCTETGLTEGSHCSRCQAVLVAQQVVAAHGHHFEYGVCTRCGTDDPDYECLEYNLNYDGASYMVTGIGTVTDSDIVIPTKYNDLSVTSIGSYAFSGCTDLTSVIIPDSVTSIGEGAFSGCSSLISIDIPFVGGDVGGYEARGLFGFIFDTNEFAGGTATKQYYNSSHSITYYLPSTLRSVTVAGGKIHYGAFENCSMLSFVELPNSTTIIGAYAFFNCSGLTTITIPDGVTSIGERAFEMCRGLSSVVIPNNCTSIGIWAFSGCSGLNSITIPNSVTIIGNDAFSGCDNAYSYSNGVYYIGNDQNKYLYLVRSTNALNDTVMFTIPSGCKIINSYAFRERRKLIYVSVPISVKDIGRGAFSTINEDRVFYYEGTMEEWSLIAGYSGYSGVGWYPEKSEWENDFSKYGSYRVECSNGTISEGLSI